MLLCEKHSDRSYQHLGGRYCMHCAQESVKSLPLAFQCQTQSILLDKDTQVPSIECDKHHSHNENDAPPHRQIYACPRCDWKHGLHCTGNECWHDPTNLMCVLDYVTWTTIQREFATKVAIDQTITQLKRVEALAKIDGDNQLLDISIQRQNETESIIRSIGTEMQDIVHDCKYIKEGLYYEILNSSKSAEAAEKTHKHSITVRERRMYALKRSTASMCLLKRVQGVELRVKLTQLLAINELLEASEARIKSVKAGLTEINDKDLPDDDRK